MEINSTFWIYLLLSLLPALVVFITVWIVLSRFLERDYKLRLLESKMNIRKEVLPLRLQAYERLALYLERISPNVLLVNQYQHGLSVQQFQMNLLESLRLEFEHNFSQQIYVSQTVWLLTRQAKEEIARIINTAAGTLDAEAPAYQLSQRVFDHILEKEDYPAQKALEVLRTEINQQFYT